MALVVLLLLLWVRQDDSVFVEALRLRSYDLMQRLEPRVESTFPVVIVDIDERSLSRFGQWPWPRTVLAQLVDRLTASGAFAVGFDIMFAEPDRTSPAALPDTLEGIDDATRSLLESLPDNDEVFAEALAKCPCVLGYSTLGEYVPSLNRNPTSPAAIAEVGGDSRGFLKHYRGVISNIPVLENAAPGRGLFVTDPGQDGLVRRVPLVVLVGDLGTLSDSPDKTESTAAQPLTVLPALSSEMLRIASHQTTYTIKRNDSGITGLVIGEFPLPTDNEAQIWLRFSESDPRRFVSAAAVLDGSVPAEQFAGRLVLIGTSAVGLRDLRATPLDLEMPGVEIQAQILENVISSSYLLRPVVVLLPEFLATVAFALLLIFLVPAVRASWSFLVLLLAISAAAYTTWHFFSTQNLLVDASFPIATAIILYAVLVYLSHYRTEKQRQRTAVAFSRYLSPVMAERVSHNPSALKLGGDERVVTVLFSDVRGFTALSERYAGSPEALTRIINQLMDAITKEIVDRLGEIDKYIGDAAMAFWNAPLDVPNHPELACRTSLAIQASVQRLNESWASEPQDDGKPPPHVSVGIGLNTGLCLVGNLGSEYRFNYSVLGDPVNLASRVEGQTKNYGVPILITEATQQGAPMMAALEVDRIAVKGKAEAVTIFALLGDESVAASDEFKTLQTAQAALLAAYRAQRWDEALAAVDALARTNPGLAGLAALYRDRIAALQAAPPDPDWDGVYVAVDK